MRLVTIDDGPRGSPGAILPSGEILHLGRAAAPGTVEAWLPGSLLGILEGGPEGLAVVRGLAGRIAGDEGAQGALRAAGALLPAATRLLPPIPRPGMIVAAGLAYNSHLNEMAGTPRPPHPTAFMKSPASVSGPGAVVTLPPQAPDAVDYEGELAVVFGRRCYRVDAADALAHVAGYTAANDLSARDWVRAVWQAEAPWEARLTWEVNIMGKQLPGFTALGPAIVTVDEIPDPAALNLVTLLNGTVMQQAQVSDLLFPIADVIAYLSRWYTFQPGDVLLTGTPAGVGVGRTPPVFMRSGDTVEVRIDRIGTLATTFTNQP